MKHKILALTGLSCSGKTYAARIIEDAYEKTVFRTSDIMVGEGEKNGFSQYYDFVEHLESKGEQAYFTLFVGLLKKANPTFPEMFCIDSVTKPSNIDILENEFNSKPFILAFDTAFNTRLERKIRRDKIERSECEKILKKYDYDKIRMGNLKLIARADFRINTDNLSEEEYLSKLSDAISKWVSSN